MDSEKNAEVSGNVAVESSPEQNEAMSQPAVDAAVDAAANEAAAEAAAGPAAAEPGAVSDPGAVPESGAVPEPGVASEPGAVPEPGTGDAASSDEAMLAMLKDLPQDDGGVSPDEIAFGATAVAPAEFPQLSEPAQKGAARNIDLLMDVNLPISIELGRTQMPIGDILSLGPGSVVELNKVAGEPVDLLVNQKIIARGEVVVIDENFGVRITQLLTPEERLRVLGEK